MTTSNADLNWIASYIWGIADDVLRDLYVRGKYRDVILPMTVLRRLDAVLEDTKQAVLDMKMLLDKVGNVEQKNALRAAAGQAFYNTSKFTLRDLRARASRQRLEADFRAWLDGFSPNVQDILENFEFRNQIPRLSKADALGTLIEKLTSPDVNLSPAPHSEAPAGARGGTQPRAASAPPDWGRHAPEPAGAGFFRHLRCDRASDRPLGASDGFLGRQLAAGGSRRLNRSSPSRLNGPDPQPDFFHGLVGAFSGSRGFVKFIAAASGRRWRAGA